MRTYTPRELRSAVTLAVLVTALAMMAVLDPSCRPADVGPPSGPVRAPRF